MAPSLKRRASDSLGSIEHQDPRPQLFYDLGSPYAYLAVERAESVFGTMPVLRPILIGGIFVLRGEGSWSQTGTRAENVAEIERRAERYGLGEIVWSPTWPDNTLQAMRAVTWAERFGASDAFARVAFRRAFRRGQDLSDPEILAEIAAEAGLDPDRMLSGIAENEVKQLLRSRTDEAWESGVRGTPVTLVGEQVLYGDDQLERAAEIHRDRGTAI